MKKILIIIATIPSATILLLILLMWYLEISPPEVNNSETKDFKVEVKNKVNYCGNSWLQQQQQGIWQLYVEGQGYSMGYANGMLTQALNQQQEQYFVNELDKKVPSKFYQFALKLFVGWFNRNLNDHVPLEYQEEIYGISKFASPEYNHIAEPYQRFLNYHAAHDIGHALQNMHLVACTAVGVWAEHAKDSSMYVGRNFDFYVGDDFAQNKVIAFVNPTTGHSFMSVTWGGMIGVISGMNDKGLTVTLNADKSEIPAHTGTPVSIIARDILQYASNIEQALAIAKKYQSFVSESFMIASAADRKIAIIEKTPTKTFLFYPDENQVFCTNHFQSDSLKGIASNLENINDSTSYYRQQRLVQLANAIPKHNQNTMALLLRNQNGKNEKPLGMGNPKAINQLIAHHSIIFNPYKRQVWVSTSPYQLGKYLYYNLDSVFANKKPSQNNDLENIAVDSFLYSKNFKHFQSFKKESQKILEYLVGNLRVFEMSDLQVNNFQALNPYYFYTYQLIGDYFHKKENYKAARSYYLQALQHDMPSETDRANLLERLNQLH